MIKKTSIYRLNYFCLWWVNSTDFSKLNSWSKWNFARIFLTRWQAEVKNSIDTNYTTTLCHQKFNWYFMSTCFFLIVRWNNVNFELKIQQKATGETRTTESFTHIRPLEGSSFLHQVFRSTFSVTNLFFSLLWSWWQRFYVLYECKLILCICNYNSLFTWFHNF